MRTQRYGQGKKEQDKWQVPSLHGRVKYCVGVWASGLLLLLLVIPGVGAQPSSGLSVTLSLSPASALLNPQEPVEATITVTNTSGSQLLITEGFSSTPFEFLLVLRNEQGQVITSNQSAFPYAEGGPPPTRLVTGVDGKLRKVQVQTLELLTSTFSTTTILANVHTAYTISNPGTYTVEVRIPARTFGAVFEVIDGTPVAQFNTAIFEGVIVSNAVTLNLVDDQDGDGFAFPTADPGIPPGNTVPDCDDGNAAVNPGVMEIENNRIDDDCNPATPDVVPVVPGMIEVKSKLKGCPGGKQPLMGLPVKVFDKDSACVQQFGTKKKNFPSIWLSSCPGPAEGMTDGQGELLFSVPPEDYLVIGEFMTPVGTMKYPGKKAKKVKSGKTKKVKLNVKLKKKECGVMGGGDDDD